MTVVPQPGGSLDPPVLAWLDAMPDGVVISDVEGQIVLVNGALEELAGYPSEELVGRSVAVLVPGYQDELRHRRADTAGSRPAHRPVGSGLERALRRKDGTEIPVDLATRVVRLEERTLVVSSVRDVSAHKQADAKIREGERRWLELVETVRLAVVGLDHGGRVTYANPFLCRLTGYREEEVLGQDWFSFCLPEGSQVEVQDVFDDLMTRGSTGRHVNPIRTKAGQERVIAWDNAVLRDHDGNPVGTMSIGEDVTDERLARQRLEAVNEVARAILDGRPVEEVFRTIVQHSRRLVDASIASIVTPEAGGDTLVVRVADGEHAPQLEGMRFSAAGSISGPVMRSGEPLAVDDVSSDPRAAQPVVQTAAVGPSLFVPLAVADRTFGTLLVGRPLGRQPFREDELRVIELFASQAAVALEHARYQEELHLLAVLDDRERIGRELHDGAIQQLFATGMKLHGVLGIVPDDAARRVREAVTELDQVVRDLRGYIWDLRPQVTEEPDAVAALRRLGRDLEVSAGVVTLVDIDPEAVAQLGRSDDLVLLARDALSNVERHAQATTCRLRVGRVEAGVLIEIEDDGLGFDPDERSNAGQGLPSLHERATVLGGTLEIDATPGEGTTIRAVVPD